jgi:chromosome segregation ATPase
MDPIVTMLLTTAAGALVGTIVGVLVMRRQIRPLISEAELVELKSSLNRSQTSLADATSNAESLSKQIVQRDAAIQQGRDELKQKQQQLDLALASGQEETVRRSAAEGRIQELSSQTVLLTEQCAKFDTAAREQIKQLAEKATQVASLQGELESGKRHTQELSEELVRVRAELLEMRSTAEQESRYRSSLEVQLRADQEQIGQANGRLAELQAERAQLEIRLQEERQFAAKGMELLMMAQEKFSGVFKAVAADSQNGNGNNGTATPPEAPAHTEDKVTGAVQSPA